MLQVAAAAASRDANGDIMPDQVQAVIKRWASKPDAAFTLPGAVRASSSRPWSGLRVLRAIAADDVNAEAMKSTCEEAIRCTLSACQLRARGHLYIMF